MPKPAGWVAAAWLAGNGFANAGPYDALPLRADLCAEACFRTAAGRELKRGADATVNQYRLYDFYRRQADQELASQGPPRLMLPPYPGLDGGRRGHWGHTNAKETAAYPRDLAPAFGPVTSAGANGEWLIIGEGGVVGIDSFGGGLTRAVPGGTLGRPEHPFGTKVDRFGFGVEVAGTSMFSNKTPEWTRDGKPTAQSAGYRLLEGSVAIEWMDDTRRWLEHPEMVKSGEVHVLNRDFRFLDAAAAGLSFRLTGTAKAPWTVEKSADGILARCETGGTTTVHRIECDPVVLLDIDANQGLLKLGNVSAGSGFRILSWAGETAKLAEAEKSLADVARNRHPLTAATWSTAGLPQIRTWEVMNGILNVDREASGSAYEIDDIYPAIDNEDESPMTLSGLDFQPDGTAFVCTLVGDVWKITGLTGDLKGVVWKRIASGLDQPMGLLIKSGLPHVLTRRQLFRLEDINHDDEIDRFVKISRMPLPDAASGHDLRLDAGRNFIFNTNNGIFRLSADGTKLDRIGQGSRNPLGLGMRPDGLVLSDSSEGNIGNGTCSIFESDHPENEHSIAKRKRLIYLPRGIDNSPGSRLFLNDERFGPLGKSILGVSYGTGSWYTLLRDIVDGTPQAALVPQRGLFTSGASRVAVHPVDGSVFVAGLDGWGDYAVSEGSLHRIRYTGRKHVTPVSWKAHRNGILVNFNTELAAEPVKPERVFVQQWNYVDSDITYGSPEYSVKQAGQIGHDRLLVRESIVQPDKRSVFFEIPDLLPSMCSQVRATLLDSSGATFELDLYPTLQRLASDHPSAAASTPEKPAVLVVPESNTGGDTYQKLTEYFDKLAGRDPTKRPVAPDVPEVPAKPDFQWIRANLIERNCLPCHGPGTPLDYTSYQGISPKLKPGDPDQSPFNGMIRTGSMPPYPMPSIPPNLQKAVREWIRNGATE